MSQSRFKQYYIINHSCVLIVEIYLLIPMEIETENLLNQYVQLSVIGKGSYAKVTLVKKKSNGKLYALKAMKKKYIQKKKQ